MSEQRVVQHGQDAKLQHQINGRAWDWVGAFVGIAQQLVQRKRHAQDEKARRQKKLGALDQISVLGVNGDQCHQNPVGEDEAYQRDHRDQRQTAQPRQGTGRHQRCPSRNRKQQDRVQQRHGQGGCRGCQHEREPGERQKQAREGVGRTASQQHYQAGAGQHQDRQL